jgi:hypothetical protein
MKYNCPAGIAANRLLAAGNFALQNKCPAENESCRFLKNNKNGRP